MVDEKYGEAKIVLGPNRVTTRADVFAKKNKFRREQARLPFEEKIRILVRLQEIAMSAQASSRSRLSQRPLVWQL